MSRGLEALAACFVLAFATFSARFAHARLLYDVTASGTGCLFHDPQGAVLISNGTHDLNTLNVGKGLGPRTCHQWSIPSSYLSESRGCTDPTSYLLLEFWAVNDSAFIGNLHTIDDFFAIAAKGEVPTVSLSSGQWCVSPAAPTNLSDVGSYTDGVAIDNKRPYHRLLIPIGQVNDGPDPWFITVANLNDAAAAAASYAGAAYNGYLMRATCMLDTALPCARPAPNVYECSNAPGGEVHGVCRHMDPDNPESAFCSCNDGWADYACGVPVSNISVDNSSLISFQMPAKTWRFFQLVLPASSDLDGNGKQLLMELAQPPLTFQYYNPSLVVHARPIKLKSPVFNNPFEVPRYTDIQQQNSLQQQALDYTYMALGPQDLQGYRLFYLGIYNNASQTVPASVNDQADSMLQLSVSWNDGHSQSAFGVGQALCPKQCWGHGTCVSPESPLFAFQCQCAAGFGGPSCEGTQFNVILSGSQAFNSGPVVIDMGEWHYYMITIDNNEPKWNKFTLNWANVLNSSSLFMVATPYYNSSAGNNFFDPTFSHQLQISAMIQLAVGDSKAWVIAIFNNNPVNESVYSYMLSVQIPTDSSSRFQPLQIGIVISVVSVVATLTVVYLLGRLVMRHHRARAMAMDAREPWLFRNSILNASTFANGDGYMGVPPSMSAAFPTYIYGKSEPDGGALTKYVRGGSNDGTRCCSVGCAHLPCGSPCLGCDAAETGPTAAAAAPAAAVSAHAAVPGGALSAGTLVAAVAAAAPPAQLKPCPAVAAAPRRGLAKMLSWGKDAVFGAGAVGHGAERQPVAGTPAGSGPSTPHANSAGWINSSSSNICLQPTSCRGSPASPTGVHAIDGPMCAVCLMEYQIGDVLRRLPCLHSFHKACIDPWMTKHTTCPICRTSLVPLPVPTSEGPADDATALHGQRATSLADREPAGPATTAAHAHGMQPTAPSTQRPTYSIEVEARPASAAARGSSAAGPTGATALAEVQPQQQQEQHAGPASAPLPQLPLQEHPQQHDAAAAAGAAAAGMLTQQQCPNLQGQGSSPSLIITSPAELLAPLSGPPLLPLPPLQQQQQQAHAVPLHWQSNTAAQYYGHLQLLPNVALAEREVDTRRGTNPRLNPRAHQPPGRVTSLQQLLLPLPVIPQHQHHHHPQQQQVVIPAERRNTTEQQQQ